MGEEKSNSLIEVFKRGFENTIEYIFYDGFVNIRAILKKNSNQEIIPQDGEGAIALKNQVPVNLPQNHLLHGELEE